MVEPKENFILGVDPGSLKVGYALIKASQKKFKILDSGTLKVSGKCSFFERIQVITKFFEDFTAGLDSYDLALESLIHVKNVSSLAKLAQARGAILASAGGRAKGVYEYAPNLVKSTVSGYGLSSKKSVEKSLSFVFPEHKFSTEDESDALAIALCHSFKGGQNQTSVKSSGRSLKNAFKHLG